ncbi:MAG: hypothetical protein ACT4O1_11395 [Gemmatimonadota bacterium]
MGILNRKNKKSRSMGPGRSDHRTSPVRTADQDEPEPERPTRPDEEAGQAVHQLKEPPQAEGQR